MKSLFSMAAAALILTAAVSGSVSAESYFLPEPLQYTVHASDGYAVTEFRPVGWSKDGRFAYIEALIDEKYNNCFVVYHITDAVTDKPVFSLTDRESWEESSADTLVKNSWKSHYQAFTAECAKSGIRQKVYTFLPSFPLAANGTEYSGQAEVSRTKESAFFTISVNAAALGVKEIGRGEERNLEQVRAGFYLPSPYEMRIIVLVEIETAMREVYYTLMGCHLKAGYGG